MAAASRQVRAERSGASAKGFSEDDYNVTIADQDVRFRLTRNFVNFVTHFFDRTGGDQENAVEAQRSWESTRICGTASTLIV